MDDISKEEQANIDLMELLLDKELISQEVFDSKSNLKIVQELLRNLSALPIGVAYQGINREVGIDFITLCVGNTEDFVELVIPTVVHTYSLGDNEAFDTFYEKETNLTGVVRIYQLEEGYSKYFKSVLGLLPNTVLSTIPLLVKEITRDMKEAKEAILHAEVIEIMSEVSAVGKPVYSAADTAELTGLSTYKVKQIMEAHKAKVEANKKEEEC